MVNVLKKYLSPPVFADEDKTQMASLLNLILLSSIGVIILGTILGILFFQSLTVQFGFSIFSLIIVVLAYLLLRMGHVKLAGIFVNLALWTGFTMLLAWLGGIESPGVGGYTVIVLGSGLLLGWEFGGLMMGLSLAAMIGLYILKLNQLIVPSVLQLPSALSINVSLLIATAVMIYLFDAQRRKILITLRRHQTDLQQSNQDLTMMQATMADRIHARTRNLEVVATSSEWLNTILDLPQLLAELVTRVKEKLGYYHVHIYLLNETGDTLMMTEGYGVAGAEMKAKGHRIPLNTPQSLVARAARSAKVVRVDDVRLATDWLSNPLLPLTRAEMAVPIIVGGQVVGVLDVQSDKIGGLGDEDASLLQSLANQAAVAIRNAQLFSQTQQSLLEARAAQERYLQQSWQHLQQTASMPRYSYHTADSFPLPQTLVTLSDNCALTRNAPAIVSLDAPAAPTQTIVSPVLLTDTPIGVFHMHSFDPSAVWNDDDLAVVEAVLTQVAQTAETLRLLDYAQQQAGREHLLTDITAKMRRTTNLQDLMQVTVDELAGVLRPAQTFVTLTVVPNQPPAIQQLPVETAVAAE